MKWQLLIHYGMMLNIICLFLVYLAALYQMHRLYMDGKLQDDKLGI
jgi:hypothetical protein